MAVLMLDEGERGRAAYGGVHICFIDLVEDRPWNSCVACIAQLRGQYRLCLDPQFVDQSVIFEADADHRAAGLG